MTKPFIALVFPPWIEWGRRQGAFVGAARRALRSPNGRPLCGWCEAECLGRRTCWCSVECAWKFIRVSTWGDLRKYIIKRDGEICTRCGASAPPVEKSERWWFGKPRSFWEVDHIVPVKHGGTDDPANLRLLCTTCHIKAGYEQRAARKAVA